MDDVKRPSYEQECIRVQLLEKTKLEQKTLRDEIAMAALTSMLSAPQNITESTYEIAAKYSYKFADAMMEERKK